MLYYILGNDTKVILNSAIIATIFFCSWIMKPICKHFKIDCSDINLFK